MSEIKVGSELKAGRDLDAAVSERVMGVSLIPPRDFAICRVVLKMVSCTGNPMSLRDGREFYVPPGDDLRQPEGSTDWNDRYYLNIGEQLGSEIDRAVDAYRLKPRPYSTDISAAWDVVARVRDTCVFSRRHHFLRHLQRRISERVMTPRGNMMPLLHLDELLFHVTPEDICLAALEMFPLPE